MNYYREIKNKIIDTIRSKKMAKINRTTAAEARRIANDVNLVLDRVYADIEDAAKHNYFSTWFYFWGLKRDMVVEVIKTLRKDGYEVELFEEDEAATEVDETKERPRGDEVLAILLGLKDKDEKSEEEANKAEEEKFLWRDILISWK